MAYIIAKYLRISAEDIDLDGFDKFESNSIANQRALIDDFISKVPEFAGCDVMEEIDDGQTGTNFSRPGVQRLIELAQAGKVHCIVVKDLSRWGRNYIEVGEYLEQNFPAWGIRFISINDMYDSANLHGTTGGIDLAFRNLMYELYSHDLSEKVRNAKTSAAKSGKYTNAMAFYGYVKDPENMRKLVIDPPAAEIVKKIFGLATRDFTPSQIAKLINDEEPRVPTPQERKIQLREKRIWKKDGAMFWYASIISGIIRDERYTGKLIYGKKKVVEVDRPKQVTVPESEWVVVLGAIPTIITDKQYRAANESVSKCHSSEHKKPRSDLLFSRKLKCGYCGMTLRAVHRKQGIRFKCGTPKYADGHGCSMNWVFEKAIAAAVLTALRQQIAFADDARKMFETRTEKLLPNIERQRNEIMRLQTLIEKAKTTKMGLWEKHHNRVISGEEFQHENEKADEHIAKCAERINKAQSRIREFEAETGCENLFVERFSGQMSLHELTREVVEEFISEITIYATDRIEIIFNFADEYAKIAELIEKR